MKNIIKKLSAFIIATLVIISLMPVMAKAEDTYTLYARVPSNWGVPNAWAWTDAGENVFSAWPGQAMTAVGDGEWYFVELPVSATNVIVNYNGDKNKTGDIKVNGTDVWLTVCADNSVVTDYTKPIAPPPEVGDKPTGNLINLVISLPDDWTYPYLWAWSDEMGDVYNKWPGEEMEAQGNGTVAKRIPDWVTGLKISANGGSIETDDIFIDPGKDVFITIYAADDMVVEYVNTEEETTVPDMPPTYADETTQANDETTSVSGGAPSNPGNPGEVQTSAPTQGSGDDNNEGKNNGFFKFLIPAVCVVVIIVVITAVKKGSQSSEDE